MEFDLKATYRICRLGMANFLTIFAYLTSFSLIRRAVDAMRLLKYITYITIEGVRASRYLEVGITIIYLNQL